MIAKLRSSFPNARLGNGFGLTETSSVSTFLPDEYAEKRPETVGFTAPPVEVDLLDVDPSSGVGELLIRGQNVVAGYWNKPEQTAETFVDGWLHTGDLARVDDEGFVQIVDRMKDMVNRGGENVYCVEVENALVEHPAVFEVAVLGVPDEMMGEKVGAVIVPRPGVEPDAAEIRAFALERIADFKAPQFITFRTEPLPRNAGGKVLKPVLRKETSGPAALRRGRTSGVGHEGLAAGAVGEPGHVGAVEVVAAVPDAGAVLVADRHPPRRRAGVAAERHADEGAGLVDRVVDVRVGGLRRDVALGDRPVEVAPLVVVAEVVDDPRRARAR